MHELHSKQNTEVPQKPRPQQPNVVTRIKEVSLFDKAEPRKVRHCEAVGSSAPSWTYVLSVAPTKLRLAYVDGK